MGKNKQEEINKKTTIIIYNSKNKTIIYNLILI